MDGRGERATAWSLVAAQMLLPAALVRLPGSRVRTAPWLALLGLLWLKARVEERKLTARFPGYAAYAAATPRLVPSPLRRRGGRDGPG